MRFVLTSDAGRSIVLRDSRNENGVGAYLLEDGVDGWFGTPSIREEPIARDQADGDYMPSTMTQGARIVTLHGYAAFDSTVECGAFEDLLNSFVCQSLTLSCEDSHGRRSAKGFISDGPDISLFPDEQSLQFTIIVTCPDSRKYGNPVAFTPSGGWCMVTNEGNCGTYPIVHVEGHITTMNLKLGSQQVTWVGDAESLDIDFRDMQPSSGAIVMDNAFEIPPGDSALAVTCDGTLTVTVKPAWR